jgi:hypothetical protein
MIALKAVRKEMFRRYSALAASLALAFVLLGCLSFPQPSSARPVDSRSELLFRTWTWSHSEEVELYREYLDIFGVAEVLPLHQLLRTASDWNAPQCREIGAQPFEVPPPDLWPSMVKTLKLLQQLKARGILGPIEAVSVYRHAELNRCAGSQHPMHPGNTAVDLVAPEGGELDLDASVAALCRFHESEGRSWQMGLGLYGYPRVHRVHIDTHSYTTWGGDVTEQSSPCVSMRAGRAQDTAGARSPLEESGTADSAPAFPR